MKKIAVVVFALAVWLSLSAFAQDAGAAGSQQGSSGSSAQSGGMGQGGVSAQGTTSTQAGTASDADKSAGKAKLKTLKGTIGQDGKTFTDDKDKKSWTIMNPEAVQGHEGHHVSVKAHVYPDKDSIHVMGVKMAGEKKGEASSSSGMGEPSQNPPQQ
jgi:hypothetical protein